MEEVEMDHLLEQLSEYFEAHYKDGICVAFSGGVDSSLLLKIACNIRKSGDRPIMAVTFDTKLHPHGDIREAKRMAESFGAVHKIIMINEFDDSEIIQNPVDRCYRCKHFLFRTLLNEGKDAGYHYVVDGSNFDDLKSYRPGMRALKELGIHSPLLDFEVTKANVRLLAQKLFVPSFDKPSAPCLATRLPYGTRLDYDVLRRIDCGEAFLRNMGFYNVRLRLHKDIVRIEVDQTEIMKLIECRQEIVEKLKELGFVYITLDLEGFRSGSMDIYM